MAIYDLIQRTLGAQKAQKAISLCEKIKKSSDYDLLSEEEKDFLRVNCFSVDKGGEGEKGWWVAKIRYSFRNKTGNILTTDVKVLEDEIPFDYIDWDQYDGTIIYWEGLH